MKLQGRALSPHSALDDHVPPFDVSPTTLKVCSDLPNLSCLTHSLTHSLTHPLTHPLTHQQGEGQSHILLGGIFGTATAVAGSTGLHVDGSSLEQNRQLR